jgi:hypothetical protein
LVPVALVVFVGYLEAPAPSAVETSIESLAGSHCPRNEQWYGLFAFFIQSSFEIHVCSGQGFRGGNPTGFRDIAPELGAAFG